MSAPRAFTGALQRVANQADRALQSSAGIEITFTVAKFGSMEACAKMARSVQVSFSSLRARDRRRKAVLRSDEHSFQRDSNAHSRYDALICQCLPLADNMGYTVSLFRMDCMLEQWEVRDIASGALIKEMDNGSEEAEVLCHQWLTFPDQFTQTKAKRLLELLPAISVDFPQLIELAGGHVQSNDPNDIPLDCDPFTGLPLGVEGEG